MLILTGKRGCGKTTLLKRLILENNLGVQGFLSLKIVEDGAIVGIKLLTLPWREEIFMASTAPGKTALSTGRYAFESETFDLIDARFAAFDRNMPFVLDEFGPLEMRGLGHYTLFKNLAASGQKLLVVVRKELLDQFLDHYAQSGQAEVLDMESGVEGLERRVHDYLAPADMSQ